MRPHPRLLAIRAAAKRYKERMAAAETGRLPGLDWIPFSETLCNKCGGLGRSGQKRCDECNGEGVIPGNGYAGDQ